MKLHSRLKSLCGAALLGAAATMPVPAMAANEAMLDLLKALYENGQITAEQYELISNAAKADAEKAEGAKTEAKQVAENAAKKVDEKIAEIPKIETGGKLKVSSQDGDFSWGLIGRVMADYNLVNSDINKIGNDAFIRRARLGMEGAMWKHWIWKLEMDFAEDSLSTKDAFIGYKSGNWWIKTGQSHIPYGLSTLSSSKYMTFIERPLLADGPLQPSRSLGVAGFMHDPEGVRWTLHTGIFGSPVGNGATNGVTDEFNVAARGTFVPFIQDKAHLASIGAGVWYRNALDRATTIAQRPGIFRSGDSTFQRVAFGTGDVDSLGFNVEALAVIGPFGLKGEYSRMNVDSPAGDVDLDGYYAEASWFITGESLNYDTKKAQFGSVAPKGVVGKGGTGAWQVAVRYDVLDLSEGSVIGSDGEGTFGGEQHVITAGLNWYVNKNIRFMLDYVHLTEMDRPGSIWDNDEPHGLTFRSQVYW